MACVISTSTTSTAISSASGWSRSSSSDASVHYIMRSKNYILNNFSPATSPIGRGKTTFGQSPRLQRPHLSPLHTLSVRGCCSVERMTDQEEPNSDQGDRKFFIVSVTKRFEGGNEVVGFVFLGIGDKF